MLDPNGIECHVDNIFLFVSVLTRRFERSSWSLLTSVPQHGPFFSSLSLLLSLSSSSLSLPNAHVIFYIFYLPHQLLSVPISVYFPFNFLHFTEKFSLTLLIFSHLVITVTLHFLFILLVFFIYNSPQVPIFPSGSHFFDSVSVLFFP